MNMQQQIVDASNMGLFPEVQVFHPLEQYNATPFTPKPYDATNNVVDQHHFPRFGHTNNFEALTSGLMGSSDTASGYITGICAGAMLIFGVALVWFMIIVGLKIAGQKRVGFLAGRLEYPDVGPASNEVEDSGTLPVIEEEPEDIESLLDSEVSSPLIISDNIYNELERAKQEKKFNRKVLAARVIFVLSGLCVIVASILFYAKGVTAFQKSLDSVHGGLELVQQTAYDAINITSNVLNEKDTLLGELKRTTRETGGGLCNGNGSIATRIKNDVAEFTSDIEDLSSMIDDNIAAFGNDLRHFVALTEEVDDKLKYAAIFFYIAVSISVLIIVLIVAMLVVTYFSAKGVSNCCTKFTTNAILWPVFIFFLVLAWIFALLFLVTSLAGSDFCVKPDQIVEGVLRQYEDQFNSVIFEYIMYYISGCKIKPAGESQIEAISTQIGDTLDTVHDFSEIIGAMSLGTLETECGLGLSAATALEGGSELLHEATHSISRGWIELRHMLECKTFNPIYTTFAHDAICVEGVDGLTWLFSTSFAMFLFAMIMIMFRAGLYPVKRPPAQAENSGVATSLLSKSGN
mmetsp:Transcript_24741/g.45497  ORF Transcript_24741/g.45497 Transcript_24741/m.45497 type:complete len:575 (+) Transcript_24741:159-1883(+)|eukprot:CAMPEP_0201911174 /NCGR_PEP_ID=MMETSP0903-20130614/2227_1 /ASSEMBLY_ACC=CAM_ASM_000552 /TAXON_ID=420261 /ORGANISM="Thalassiosira antarctica, Strain CCMP982" /LENGTH=574 /DNA_ID=CAMNT_0048445865 /DNA_START=98 /DNA_END=1822 /DNA_ORIENTATION=-